MKRHSFAFDFDGVIASYNGFKGANHTQPPIPAVVDAIRTLKERGHTIIIHSTRGEKLLRQYLEQHNIPFDYINENPARAGENPGKPVAYAYIDDRAVCYKGQSADELVHELTTFKAYWQ